MKAHQSKFLAVTVGMLMVVASCGRLCAVPANSPEYTVNGSQVTGAGVNATTAFFSDLDTNTYQVTINSSADLGNTTQDELNFYSGTVNNAGTLSTTGNYITVNLRSDGTVTNSGTIMSSGGDDYAIYEEGSGSVNNSGMITSTYLPVYSDVNVDGTANANVNFTLNNYASGAITGTTYGVYTYDYAEDETANGANVVTHVGNNAGTISGSEAYTVYNYNESNQGSSNIVNTAINNTGTISSSNDTALYLYYAGNYEDYSGASTVNTVVNNSASGVITGADYGIYTYELQNYDSTNSPQNIDTLTINNNGLITGTADEGIYLDEMNNEYNTGSTSSVNILNIVNGSTGVISGGEYGIYLDELYNDDSDGVGTNTLVLSNAGTITGTSYYGIYLDEMYNEDLTGAGLSTNTATLSNVGTISGGDYGLYVDEFYNDGNAGSGVNTFALNNSGTITGPGDYGIYLDELYNENLTGAGTSSNTFSLINSNTISGEDYGLYVEELYNDGNAGAGVNTFTISNSGNITGTSDYGIYLEDLYNYDLSGSGANTFSLNNTNTISSQEYGIYVDSIYNDAISGDATNTVGIYNSGNITGSSDGGVYFESIYNDDATGVARNTFSLTNTGHITTTTDGEGVSNDDMYNEEITGKASNTFTLNNSGVISSYADAIESEMGSYYVTGTSTNTYSFNNSGMISSSDGAGVYLYAYNEYNTDADKETLTFMNSGNITAYAIAVNTELDNDYDYNPGTETNAQTLVNTGTIISTEDYALELENYSEPSNVAPANSVNTIDIANQGAIRALDEGVYAYNYNTIQATSQSTNSITLFNAGTINSTAEDAVYLYNDDTNTAGAQANTIDVINTATGTMQGSDNGLYLENDLSGPTTSADYLHVTNAGNIIGGTYGVYFDGDNGMLLTEGGAITGPTDAVYLSGVDSNVTIQGRTAISGVIEGNGHVGNTLVFNLPGMTSAQIAAAQLAINTAAGGPGSFQAANDTYNFDGFQAGNIIFHGFSFASAVDSGLSDLASRIDNNPLPNGSAFDAVYAAGAINPEAALDNLSGREFLNAFQQVNLSTATAISQLADSRAFNLRNGATGFDFSGLNIHSSSMIASLGDTANTLDRLSASSVFGGTAMSDSKESSKAVMASPGAPPWGAWVSGTVTFGDESGSSQPKYNSTAGSPTIGVDYRVCHDLVVGALFNYTTTGVDFGDGSDLNEDTYLGALYADWAHGGLYVNGLVGGGYDDYDQDRTTLAGTTAHSSSSGDEILANVAGGYDFKFGSFTVSPEVGLQYTHLEKDSFSESGGGALNLNVGNQDIDSLRTRLGVNLLDTFNFMGVKITPQVNAFWYHECLDDTTGVTNGLPGAPAIGSFTIRTNNEGRDFAAVGTGITAVPSHLDDGNISFFVNYEAQVGQNDFMANTVDGGVKVQF